MVGTKIACPRDGQHKNNSPKGWMGGELYGGHEITRQKDRSVESYMVGIKVTNQIKDWRIKWSARK